jgi:hypothetical protein
METPENIIEKIKAYQNKTIIDLYDNLVRCRSNLTKYSYINIENDVQTTINFNIEKKEKERELRFNLISQVEYDNWLARQNNIQLMNQEIQIEEKEKEKKREEEFEILNISFHVRYMLDKYTNPNIQLPVAIAPNWQEFNDLIKKYNIENSSYIVQTIENYNSSVETATKKDAMSKIWIGFAILGFFYYWVKGC